MVSGPQVSSVFCWWLSHVSVASTEVPTAVLFLYFIPKPIQAFPTFSLDYDFKLWLQDVVFQSLSLVQLFVTPWTAACQASLSIANSWSFSNSCPSSRWYHPTILSSVIPFLYCLQSFPASGFFPISWFFTSGGQSIGVWALTLVLPMNTQTDFL